MVSIVEEDPIGVGAFGAPNEHVPLPLDLAMVNEDRHLTMSAAELRECSLALPDSLAGIALESVGGRVDQLLGLALRALHLPEGIGAGTFPARRRGSACTCSGAPPSLAAASTPPSCPHSGPTSGQLWQSFRNIIIILHGRKPKHLTIKSDDGVFGNY